MKVLRIIAIAASPKETQYLPSDVEIVLTDLGKVAAAIATTRVLAGLSPEQRSDTLVINIGSCGALRTGLGGIYEPGTVINHDISADAIRELGYDPKDMLTIPGGDASITLATGDLFVADTTTRDTLARRADLVDMEGYAVVRACQEFDVAVRLVKHVSDDADEAAFDWNESVERSARDLGRWWQAQDWVIRGPRTTQSA